MVSSKPYSLLIWIAKKTKVLQRQIFVCQTKLDKKSRGSTPFSKSSRNLKLLLYLSCALPFLRSFLHFPALSLFSHFSSCLFDKHRGEAQLRTICDTSMNDNDSNQTGKKIVFVKKICKESQKKNQKKIASIIRNFKRPFGMLERNQVFEKKSFLRNWNRTPEEICHLKHGG